MSLLLYFITLLFSMVSWYTFSKFESKAWISLPKRDGWKSYLLLTLSVSPLLFVEGSYSHGIKYEIIPSSEASSTMALVIWTSDPALNVKSLEQLESKSSDFSFFTINDSMGQNKLRKTRLEQTRLRLFYESKFGGFKAVFEKKNWSPKRSWKGTGGLDFFFHCSQREALFWKKQISLRNQLQGWKRLFENRKSSLPQIVSWYFYRHLISWVFLDRSVLERLADLIFDLCILLSFPTRFYFSLFDSKYLRGQSSTLSPTFSLLNPDPFPCLFLSALPVKGDEMSNMWNFISDKLSLFKWSYNDPLLLLSIFELVVWFTFHRILFVCLMPHHFLIMVV